MARNTLDSAKCPHCKTKFAQGRIQVEKLFGVRNYANSVYVQSWCRECRSTCS